MRDTPGFDPWIEQQAWKTSIGMISKLAKRWGPIVILGAALMAGACKTVPNRPDAEAAPTPAGASDNWCARIQPGDGECAHYAGRHHAICTELDFDPRAGTDYHRCRTLLMRDVGRRNGLARSAKSPVLCKHHGYQPYVRAKLACLTVDGTILNGRPSYDLVRCRLPSRRGMHRQRIESKVVITSVSSCREDGGVVLERF